MSQEISWNIRISRSLVLSYVLFSFFNYFNPDSAVALAPKKSEVKTKPVIEETKYFFQTLSLRGDKLFLGFQKSGPPKNATKTNGLLVLSSNDLKIVENISLPKSVKGDLLLAETIGNNTYLILWQDTDLPQSNVEFGIFNSSEKTMSEHGDLDCDSPLRFSVKKSEMNLKCETTVSASQVGEELIKKAFKNLNSPLELYETPIPRVQDNQGKISVDIDKNWPHQQVLKYKNGQKTKTLKSKELIPTESKN